MLGESTWEGGVAAIRGEDGEWVDVGGVCDHPHLTSTTWRNHRPGQLWGILNWLQRAATGQGGKVDWINSVHCEFG